MAAAGLQWGEQAITVCDTEAEIVNNNRHKLNKFYNVWLSFEDGVSDEKSTTTQCSVTIQGEVSSVQKAKNYIQALTKPEFRMLWRCQKRFAHADVLLDPEILENVESEHAVVIEIKERELELAGTQPAVRQAISLLQDLAQSEPLPSTGQTAGQAKSDGVLSSAIQDLSLHAGGDGRSNGGFPAAVAFGSKADTKLSATNLNGAHSSPKKKKSQKDPQGTANKPNVAKSPAKGKAARAANPSLEPVEGPVDGARVVSAAPGLTEKERLEVERKQEQMKQKFLAQQQQTQKTAQGQPASPARQPPGSPASSYPSLVYPHPPPNFPNHPPMLSNHAPTFPNYPLVYPSAAPTVPKARPSSPNPQPMYPTLQPTYPTPQLTYPTPQPMYPIPQPIFPTPQPMQPNPLPGRDARVPGQGATPGTAKRRARSRSRSKNRGKGRGQRSTSTDDKGALRHIVIDGLNVATAHGRGTAVSFRGLQLAVDYFRQRGHQHITAFVPEYIRYKKSDRPNKKPVHQLEILDTLEKANVVHFTPSRRLENGQVITSYDDRYVIELAEREDGIIVSRDQYRDLLKENARWKTVIEERILPFNFVGDFFMVPQDPLGRHGPRLDDFLRKSPSGN